MRVIGLMMRRERGGRFVAQYAMIQDAARDNEESPPFERKWYGCLLTRSACEFSRNRAGTLNIGSMRGTCPRLMRNRERI